MILREETTVIDLLRQREAELVKVWECEEGIRNILGITDFPYPAVPDLPSRRKLGKKASRRVPQRSQSAIVPEESAAVGGGIPEVRGLTGDETAYRLEFTSRGRQESSFQTELDAVRKMFLIKSPEFSMLKVETVVFRSVDDWDVKAVLWPHDKT